MLVGYVFLKGSQGIQGLGVKILVVYVCTDGGIETGCLLEGYFGLLLLSVQFKHF